MKALASYTRTGGRPPVDDERLRIAADGTWTLWRTMGGPRVGAFRGRLPADRRRRLAAALDEAAGPRPRPMRARPDSAHEAFVAGARRLDVPAGQPVGGAWHRLAGLLRRWSETLTEEPDVALELVPGPPGEVTSLARHGTGSLRIWPATLALEVYARDRDGIVVDRAASGTAAEAGSPRGEPITTGPGWALPLGLPRRIDAPAGGSVETWVWLDIEGPDGPVRARLTATRAS